jgi:hypothetical protein
MKKRVREREDRADGTIEEERVAINWPIIMKNEGNVPALNPYHPTQSMDIPMNVTRIL